MASSAVSLVSQSQTTQSSYQSVAAQARQDINKLAQSLQNGNLDGAQQAYAGLQQLLGGQTSGGTTASSPQSAVSKDFAALGQALQAGDLSGAQNAFATLKTDLSAAAQSGGGAAPVHHHGHHHRAEAADSDSSSSTGSASASSSTNQTGGNYSFLG